MESQIPPGSEYLFASLQNTVSPTGTPASPFYSIILSC